jgi:hypothetical protein
MNDPHLRHSRLSLKKGSLRVCDKYRIQWDLMAIQSF